MKLLLDTHALIWALSDPDCLPAPVREVIEDPANEIYASAASAWEIAIKAALGKIDFPLETLSEAITATGFIELPVSIRHAIAVRQMPHHHRDPFDRLLIAQAITDGMTIASRDPEFRSYSVDIRWSR